MSKLPERWLKPWPIFEVTWWGDSFLMTAATASKARAENWSRLQDASYGITFREMLSRVQVRRHQGELLNDGYDYVRKAYGREVSIGDRIVSGGRAGLVVYPNRFTTSMVHVAFDGVGHAMIVHPLDFTPEGVAATADAA